MEAGRWPLSLPLRGMAFPPQAIKAGPVDGDLAGFANGARSAVFRYSGGHVSLSPRQISSRPWPSRKQLPDQRPGWRSPSPVI